MQEISPEKRILLAFVLAFLVLLGWSAYMKRTYPPPPAPSEAPPVARPEPAGGPSPPKLPPVLPTRKPPVAVAAKQAEEERVITVETAKATIRLSTRGARVVSWTLTDYTDEAGEPLDLVAAGETRLGYPLELQLVGGGTVSEKEAVEERLNQALFVAMPDGPSHRAPMELLLEWSDGTWSAQKRLRFGEGYQIEVETRVFVEGEPVAHRLTWAGGFGEPAVEQGAAYAIEAQVFVRTPDGLRRQPARQAGETTGWLWKTPSPFPYRGAASYAGIDDRYFAAVFLPQQPELDAVVWKADWKPEEAEKPLPIGAIAVGVPEGTAVRLYVGPKAIDVLDDIKAPALSTGVPEVADELVDFGWFWWVAKPLFLAMEWMYEHWVANYGWVIVLLTILINTVLFPLKWKSMLSAWKMQKLAPQLRAIQSKYKQYRFNDPRKQQMQVEMMALYKQHGVNPVGGCFPLLLQLPFFYGFYKVLAVAIELRHAPWFGWIQDLSQKDPYYVLPIVMTLTMYVSTRMTPMTTADPAQQKMMRLFPLLFGFFFLHVSSGLVLYWLMSSLVGIAQQWWINRHQRHLELAEKVAAKERKKKKRRGELPGEQA